MRMVCLIQSSVTDLGAVLGSGQDGVLSDAVMNPYSVQDVAGTLSPKSLSQPLRAHFHLER